MYSSYIELFLIIFMNKKIMQNNFFSSLINHNLNVLMHQKMTGQMGRKFKSNNLNFANANVVHRIDFRFVDLGFWKVILSPTVETAVDFIFIFL